MPAAGKRWSGALLPRTLPLLRQRGRKGTLDTRRARPASAEIRIEVRSWHSAPKPGDDRRIAVGNVAPVTGVMAPLLAQRVVAVPLSVPVPVKQGQSLMVDLDMPRAKVQYAQSPERREDRAADPAAPADRGASEDGEKRRIIGVGPRAVGRTISCGVVTSLPAD
jgi:hypothetical protein